LQKLDTHRLWQLMPPYPGEAPATQIDLAQMYRDLGVYRSAPADAATPVSDLHSTHPWALWAREFVAQIGEVGNKGSNNWVVSGERTPSGKPLLANDPHLDLSAPAIWYFASLESPAGRSADGQPIKPLKVMGATLPGLPFVVLGRTEGVAWAFTNTGPDVQDLYLEKINPERPGEVQIPDGRWQALEERLETIKVKGQADDVFKVRRSRHGPIISDAQASYGQWVDLNRYAIALRWGALDPDNRTIVAGLMSNQANTVDELFAAFSHHHSPMQSALAADTTGTIRMQAVGRAPLRRPDNDLMGVAPAPGWDPRYDWKGWIPYGQNPRDDGQKGWMATANQRIVGPDYPYHLTQDWILPYRYNRIAELLTQSQTHDMASMQAIQADVKSAAALKLLPLLLRTSSDHPLAAPAMAELRGFDGEMKPERAAPLILAVWIDELTRALIEPHLGAERFNALYAKRNFRAGIEGMLARDDRFWCGAQGCQPLMKAALDRALERIAAEQGKEVSNWRWGQAHPARSAHRPFDRVPLLARWFNVSTPTGGDLFTVNVGQYFTQESTQPFANRQAASMRAIYDLADLEKSVFIYQTGQSGVVFSPRYRDMAAEWGTGQYRPLQFKPPVWRHELTLTP
jgi:penicillin amidase